MHKVNVAEKLTQFEELWRPRIVGELNGQFVKLAKVQGEFDWHHHDNEDELFMVVKGSLTIEFADGEVALDEGEFLIVPRGVEHRPAAANEAHILLLEPATTLNTGNVHSDKTVEDLEWI
jgi:mannose-6-phosphate isomerase-like protein (cupin superfamily)